MVLRIQTNLKRKNYLWCMIGMISISLNLYLTDSDFVSTGSWFYSISSRIAIESLLMSGIGLLFTIISCLRMYIRLGIVPGIYHSTLCIPSYQFEEFSFKTSKGLYFGLLSGLSSFILYSSQILIVNNIEKTAISSLQMQICVGLALLAYCYFCSYETRHETIGIALGLAFSSLQMIYYQKFSLYSIAFGVGLIIANLFFLSVIIQGKNTLDQHTLTILAVLSQGFLGLLLALVLFTQGTLEFYEISVLKAALNCIWVISVTRCEKIELAFLFTYPTIYNLLTNDLTYIEVISISGVVASLAIAVLGDIPFTLCQSYPSESEKSPLHSPLL